MRVVNRFASDRGDLTRLEDGGAELQPGSGPRHIALDAGERHLYVINELSSTVTMFDWNATTASATSRQTVSTLPDDVKVENSTAEIAIHPSGKFLYGSNRGHDSIAVFAIDGSTGRLTRRRYRADSRKRAATLQSRPFRAVAHRRESEH